SKSLGIEDRLIKKDDGQLLWVGDFEELKRFSKEVLHLPGKWTSPGGDAKSYSDENLKLKWSGPSKKKLLVVKDENSCISNILKEKTSMKTTEKSVCTDEHVAAMTSTEATGKSEHHETCDKCHSKDTEILHMKKEITEIKTIIKELGKNQRESEYETEKSLSKTKDAMKNMSTLNYKMADEIESLKTVIEQITSENNQMKIILEMKQNEWIEVEKNKASSTTKSTSVTSTPKSYAAVVSNSFESLVDKHTTNESSNDDLSHLTETSVENDNFNCPPENISSRSQSTIDQQSNKNESNVDNPNPTKKILNPPKVLVIGDSMVKHICQEKLSYAAKAKTICKSYRGARIKE
ncbi:Hypothetical predicted protein, partial [Paramuricea clavata]